MHDSSVRPRCDEPSSCGRAGAIISVDWWCGRFLVASVCLLSMVQGPVPTRAAITFSPHHVLARPRTLLHNPTPSPPPSPRAALFSIARAHSLSIVNSELPGIAPEPPSLLPPQRPRHLLTLPCGVLSTPAIGCARPCPVLDSAKRTPPTVESTTPKIPSSCSHSLASAAVFLSQNISNHALCGFCMRIPFP